MAILDVVIRRRRMAAALLLLSVLAVGYLLASYLSSTSHRALPPSTWYGVNDVLDAAVRSEQYRDGGIYLSDPSQLDSAGAQQRDAYSYRLAIDFLRSLTPEQVAHFQRKRALPYHSLRPDQQKALVQLAGSRLDGYVPGRVSDSYLTMTPILKKQEFLFNWLRPTAEEAQVAIMFDMSFSANENARFLSPYRPSY